MSDPIYTTVAYVSGDCFAVSNAAGDAFAGEFAAGVRVWADCRADGIRLGTVTAATHAAAAGRTLVTVALDAGAVLTPNLAAVLHGNDIPESLCSHAAHHAIGGRDPLWPASSALAGLVRLASAVEAQAGANADKAVTPAGLALAAKGLISADTTIHVATTGSDVTGTGAAGTPFASISRALASIANKLIASGATVTIQVADGRYSLASTIAIDHPDGNKIQIIGNTAAETSVAITAIDVALKTIAVAGNYAAGIHVGDELAIAGSTTAGLDGSYTVSGVAYSAGNTVVTCAAETFASAVVGGGTIVIKPCNRCELLCAPGLRCLNVTSGLLAVYGFRIVSSGGSETRAISAESGAIIQSVGAVNILLGFTYGIYAASKAYVNVFGPCIKACTIAVLCTASSVVVFQAGRTMADGCYAILNAYDNSFIRLPPSLYVQRNCTFDFYPAANTPGNNNSYIAI